MKKIKRLNIALIITAVLLMLNVALGKNYAIGYSGTQQTGYGDVVGIELHYVAMESKVSRFKLGEYLAFIPMYLRKYDESSSINKYVFIGYKIMWYRKGEAQFVRLTLFESLLFESWRYK